MFLFFWAMSVLAVIFIAAHKRRSIAGWFILGLFFGPLALILALLSVKNESREHNLPAQYKKDSLGSIRGEFEEIKKQFSALNTRLNNLEIKISALGQEAAEAPAPEASAAEEISPMRQPREPAVSAVIAAEKPQSSREDIEMSLGKFWLNKIGVVVFSLGIAFLLTYTFAYFGPLAKILFGYLIAVAMFIAGIRLEKRERFTNYGRVLLGGAWAIAYFTTYAMHHFEASRVINNRLLDLLLLGVVAFGIIAYSLRYKSQALTAIALFVGYVTSVLGNVEYFTLVSAGILAAAALVLVYKMQWIRFIFLGIILTYLTHFAWVMKQIYFSRVPVGQWNVESVYFFFHSGFLLLYWGLFSAATHLIKENQAGSLYKKLAAANFTNFLLFFFMVYPKFHILYPQHKFTVVLGLGLVYLFLAAAMELLKRNTLFTSDIIIGVSLLTLSIPLKFLPYHAIVAWFIEVPFLLLIGFIFERKVYRYLAFAVSLLLFAKFTLGYWGFTQNVQLFSFTVSWKAFLSSLGFFSSAACFCLYRKKDSAIPDKILQNAYSVFAVTYLTIFVAKTVRPPWLTLGFSLESLAVFALGALFLDKYIRACALAVLVAAGMRFCFYGNLRHVSEMQQLLLVYGPIACAFTEYALYRRLNRKALIPEPEKLVSKFLFFAAESLLVFAVVVYVQQVWITLSLAIIAIAALLWGAKISDAHIRAYSLLVLVLVAVRFLAIDTYQGFGRLFQWALIIAKLACAYAMYSIYRTLDRRSLLRQAEKPLANLLFYFSSFLMVAVIFKYVEDIWVSVSLGIAGVVLFVLGFLLAEKVFRHGGFIIFGITLARVVFVDLAGLAIIYKIISFIIVGVLFLGVSFIYTKYMTEKAKR
ncbi:MAG: DUF2339 domain-containing protein [Candidatus Omnitrophica bacterium]|nr:DUF2339 domain-containing protein [Candidatus Omnitrophota bacterium]